MKKSLVLTLSVIAALTLVGCKSQESAYKKAYEKAKAQEATTVNTYNNYSETTPATTVVTPTTSANEYDNTYNTYTNTTNNYNNNNDNYTANTANVKRYAVVVGSFESQSGAEARRQQVANDGYGAAKIIPGGLGYRVIATSFSDLQAAKNSRNTLIKKVSCKAIFYLICWNSGFRN